MTKDEQRDEQLDLLKNVHYQARGVIRNNGADKKRFYEYYDRLVIAVREFNKFDEDNDLE